MKKRNQRLIFRRLDAKCLQLRSKLRRCLRNDSGWRAESCDLLIMAGIGNELDSPRKPMAVWKPGDFFSHSHPHLAFIVRGM